MKYKSLILLLLGSCSSLVPSPPSMPSVTSVKPPASTKATQVLAESTDQVMQWVLLCTILVFVFPSLRAPIVGFFTAFFGILALPFSLGKRHILMLYNKKYGRK